MNDPNREFLEQPERDLLAGALNRFSQEAQVLTQEVRDLKTTVVAERKGRRLTVRLFLVSIVVLAAIMGGRIADLRAKDAQNCRNRLQGRVDVRSAIDATVDEVALYFVLDSDERIDLRKRAALRVDAELPDPSC